MNQVVSIFDLASVPRGRARHVSVSLLALITLLYPPHPVFLQPKLLFFLPIFFFPLLFPSDIYPAF